MPHHDRRPHLSSCARAVWLALPTLLCSLTVSAQSRIVVLDLATFRDPQAPLAEERSEERLRALRDELSREQAELSLLERNFATRPEREQRRILERRRRLQHGHDAYLREEREWRARVEAAVRARVASSGVMARLQIDAVVDGAVVEHVAETHDVETHLRETTPSLHPPTVACVDRFAAVPRRLQRRITAEASDTRAAEALRNRVIVTQEALRNPEPRRVERLQAEADAAREAWERFVVQVEATAQERIRPQVDAAIQRVAAAAGIQVVFSCPTHEVIDAGAPSLTVRVHADLDGRPMAPEAAAVPRTLATVDLDRVASAMPEARALVAAARRAAEEARAAAEAEARRGDPPTSAPVNVPSGLDRLGLASLVQRIRETTAEVARERGVAIVLEARHVLAGRGLVDLSDAVLERLVPRPAR
jgi:hypothetical protein